MSSQADPRRSLRVDLRLGMFGLALVATAAVFAVTGVPGWIAPAPMSLLGIPSPLEGMTRSFVATASGRLDAAFAFHPLGPLAFACAAAAPVLAAIAWLRGARLEPVARAMRSRRLWAGVVAAFSVVWVSRLAA